VSITAERELAVAQQKQAALLLDARLAQYKEQLARLQRQHDEQAQQKLAQQQLDAQLVALRQVMRAERRQHLEEVLQLKLVATQPFQSSYSKVTAHFRVEFE